MNSSVPYFHPWFCFEYFQFVAAKVGRRFTRQQARRITVTPETAEFQKGFEDILSHREPSVSVVERAKWNSLLFVLSKDDVCIVVVHQPLQETSILKDLKDNCLPTIGTALRAIGTSLQSVKKMILIRKCFWRHHPRTGMTVSLYQI